MTNWTHKQKPDNEFMSSFPRVEVKRYLGINEDGFPISDPAFWFLDSFQLINIQWPNIYQDYSFIVVPASKGLEYWIFKIAQDLKIEIKTEKVGVVRDQIESYLGSVLDEVEKRVGDSIKIDISYLRNFIREYRHNVVHYEHKIENSTLAKSKVFVIFERINTVTEKLISAGLIKPRSEI